jgi:hypothetical protein
MMILSVVMALRLAEVAAPASLQADLDGSGAVETITAVARGKGLRIEVADARGARLARVDTAPRPSAAARIEISSGSLGSSGELVEVVRRNADGSEECRSLWRYRDRTLSPVPITGRLGPILECGKPEGWQYRWEASEGAPAEYVRERTRTVADGSHYQKETYRYTGFRAEFDPTRSVSQINGVRIPSWSTATLYPRTAVERVTQRYDLSLLRQSPRLRFETDPEKGVFAAAISRPGRAARLLVTSAVAGEEKNTVVLTLASGPQSGSATVRLSTDGTLPVEAQLSGLGEDVSVPFAVVTASNGPGLEAYLTAEEELALHALPGTWDARDGERLEIQIVSVSPTILRLGSSEFVLDTARAPAGTDILLVPRSDKSPALAITLRGPDIFARTRVSCAPTTPCRTEGDSKLFRRLGSALVVR